MRRPYLFAILFPCVFAAALSQQVMPSKPFSPDDQYMFGPDSQPQPGVPEGKITEFLLRDSKTYPGFEHRWWLYIPAGYDRQKPIALMVFQDGTQFVARDGSWGRVSVVLNNLIAKKELPVMAAVFVDPGQSPNRIQYEKASDGSPLIGNVSKFNNRSIEYESLNADYANFLIEEILPQIRPLVKITDNPQGRAVGGLSSGANCALTVAWQRPDQFGKVFSAIGSFPLILRGQKGLPQRILEADRKPIRIFLQDGAQDFSIPEWGFGADRHKDLIAALKAKGYDYRYDFGAGTHSPAHEASILPEALRWLWRDYPR